VLLGGYGKPAWRARLLAARRELGPRRRAELAASLSEQVSALPMIRPGARVAAYVPIRDEPGSIVMLDALGAAGAEVLLPVVVGAQPLDWAVYTGADGLARARYGLREPAGARLGATALGRVDVLLVPALAVDRRGVRLGLGAGHYDRSLPLAAPGAPRLAVVYDDEVVDELPREEHDVLMTGAVTPLGGLIVLPDGRSDSSG
jgi:5-formyltetrahydrofolate cyclo-ligase